MTRQSVLERKLRQFTGVEGRRLKIVGNRGQGDCFFECVKNALGAAPPRGVSNPVPEGLRGLTTAQLRARLADGLTQDKFETYKVLHEADPNDVQFEWMEGVETLEDMKQLARRPCEWWADETAIGIVEESLGIKCVLVKEEDGELAIYCGTGGIANPSCYITIVQSGGDGASAHFENIEIDGSLAFRTFADLPGKLPKRIICKCVQQDASIHYALIPEVRAYRDHLESDGEDLSAICNKLDETTSARRSTPPPKRPSPPKKRSTRKSARVAAEKKSTSRKAKPKAKSARPAPKNKSVAKKPVTRRRPSPQRPSPDADLRQDDEAKLQDAMRQYSAFYGVPMDSVTIEQILGSSAGLEGWRTAKVAPSRPSPVPQVARSRRRSRRIAARAVAPPPTTVDVNLKNVIAAMLAERVLGKSSAEAQRMGMENPRGVLDQLGIATRDLDQIHTELLAEAAEALPGR